MKFTGILSIIALASFALVNAESDCTKINKLGDDDNQDYYISKCEENADGKVKSLSYLKGKSPEMIEKYGPFDTIEYLNYQTEDLQNNQVSFEKLTNLKEFIFSSYRYDEFGYRDYYTFSVNRGTFAKDGLKLPKGIEKLSFRGLEFNQDAIDELATLSNLKEIEFEYCKLDKLNFEAISKLENLTSLTIIEYQGAENYNGYLATNVLKHFKHLKKLNLQRIELSNELIKEISVLTELEELNLDSTLHDHLNYEPLKSLTKLTTLNVNVLTRRSRDFNEDILKYLKNLKVLKLNHIGEMSSDLINDINGLSDLEELVIVPNLSYDEYHNNVQPFDITSLNNLKKLETLVLDGQYIYYNGKYDLSLFKNLKHLSINNGVFQEHIDQISKLSELEELELINADFGKLNIDSLKNLKKLASLNISGDRTYVEYLKEIPKFIYELPNLKKLVIFQFMEGSIPVDLTKNKKLEYLSFKGNYFNSIPAELATLPNLKYINIYNNDIKEVPKELEGIVHFDEEDAPYTLTTTSVIDDITKSTTTVDEIIPTTSNAADETIPTSTNVVLNETMPTTTVVAGETTPTATNVVTGKTEPTGITDNGVNSDVELDIGSEVGSDDEENNTTATVKTVTKTIKKIATPTSRKSRKCFVKNRNSN